MTLANHYADQLSSNPAYRAWFERWWSADFSLSGRKSDLLSNGYVRRHDFGGRLWCLGWAPPHDLEGNTNDQFERLDESSTHASWWQYVRTDLAGAYLAGGGPGYIQHSVPGISFCHIDKDIHLASQFNNIDLTNCFSNGFIKVQPQSICKISFSNATVLQDLRITSNRDISYDGESGYVGGDLCIDAPESSGVIEKMKIRGALRVKGSLTGKSLRAREVHISGTAHDIGKIKLSRTASRALNVSGKYSEIELKDTRIADVHISTTENKAVQSDHLTAKTVLIQGNISKLLLVNSTIRRSIELFNIVSEEIDISFSYVSELRGTNVIVPTLKMEDSTFKGSVTVQKSQVTEALRGGRAKFSAPVSFSRCALPGQVDFTGASFEKGASFAVGSGLGIASSSGFKEIGRADFSGVTFGLGENEICANFDGRQMQEAATFEACRFDGVPMFYECAFHENISFRGAVFHIQKPPSSYISAWLGLDWSHFISNLPKSILPAFRPLELRAAWRDVTEPLRARRATENLRLSKYETAYNALRQRFAEVGNAKEERRFHNHELRARRKRIDADAPAVEGAISYVYDAFSEYGQSISRPLVVLLFVWLFFSASYFLLAGVWSEDAVIESSVFSARQIVKPFSSWSRDFALSAAPVWSSTTPETAPWIRELFAAGTQHEVGRSTLIRLGATAESFLSLVLLFLSGLAVRRTFGVG